MNFLKWLFYITMSIILTVICYLFGWAIVLTTKSNGDLPKCFYWLQSYGANMNGDEGWNDPTSHPLMNKVFTYPWQNKIWKYFRYYCWLIRNPAQIWDNEIAGIVISPNQEITVSGNIHIGNHPITEGYCKASVGNAWQFYYVHKTFGKNSFRFCIGYWLQDYLQDPNQTYIANVKFICNPFMTYTD